MDRAFRAREDPEDVVQTVFRTFFRRAAKGEFRIQHYGELWALLATITRHKVLKRAEGYRTQKRDPDRETTCQDDQLAGREPDAPDVAITAELIEKTLAGMDSSYVEVFQMRLQGCTETEIATKVGGTRTAVRCKLQRLRQRLMRLNEPDSERQT
jgi:RNA polymerase sigma-70 factor (ECF subfamily)